MIFVILLSGKTAPFHNGEDLCDRPLPHEGALTPVWEHAVALARHTQEACARHPAFEPVTGLKENLPEALAEPSGVKGALNELEGKSPRNLGRA